jgi:long-chain acyl-CoA synthetase
VHVGREYQHRPNSAGPAVPVGEMKIMSLDGAHELPVGQIGELWVKGPQVVKGYWNNPEATAVTFVEGWLKTGDLARLDDEGFLYVVDRVKDMVIRGGENIYCVEVEDELYRHPEVMDAAVVGLPHRTLGEEPAGVVHLRPGGVATEDQLREFLRSRVAAFKVPVKIIFWPDMLPRNPNGKIVKSRLKEYFLARSQSDQPK